MQPTNDMRGLQGSMRRVQIWSLAPCAMLASVEQTHHELQLTVKMGTYEEPLITSLNEFVD